MDKVVISVDEMADILKTAFDENVHCISDEYCKMCSEMHGFCPVDDIEDCPHEDIVEYRYFILRHFKNYIFKDSDVKDNKWFNSPEMLVQYYESEFSKALSSFLMQYGLNLINALHNVDEKYLKEK